MCTAVCSCFHVQLIKTRAVYSKSAPVVLLVKTVVLVYTIAASHAKNATVCVLFTRTTKQSGCICFANCYLYLCRIMDKCVLSVCW